MFWVKDKKQKYYKQGGHYTQNNTQLKHQLCKMTIQSLSNKYKLHGGDEFWCMFSWIFAISITSTNPEHYKCVKTPELRLNELVTRFKDEFPTRISNENFEQVF